MPGFKRPGSWVAMLLLAPCLSSPTHPRVSRCPAVLTQVVSRATQEADQGTLAFTLFAMAGVTPLFKLISDGLQVDLVILDAICYPLEQTLTLLLS